MKRLYANRKTLIEGVTTYMALEDNIVIENFNVIYGEEKTERLVKNILDMGVPMYSIMRLCNFVVVMRFAPKNGFSLELMEYEDLNQGLERFKTYQGKNWKPEDIDKIMKLVQEISENNSELCEVSIVPIAL